MTEKIPDDTRDILARTLWGEAACEGRAGLEAVACVILNRARLAARRQVVWWGQGIRGICLKPRQFSCWNRDDPVFPRLQKLTLEHAGFRLAWEVAGAAMAHTLVDMTGGATHYHADYVSAKWAKGQTPSARIGRHIFYNLYREHTND